MRLGGVTEVADELRVSRQRLATLRERPDFPDPIGEIAAGQIWDLDAIQRWGGSQSRRPGRQPNASKQRLLGGRFMLEDEPIGKGAFADVFRAADLKETGGGDGGVVAVKILRDAEDRETAKRFDRELRILAELDHPHVIPIIDFGGNKDSGPLWYAMPLARGNLADEVEFIHGDDALILDVIRQIGAGLAYVHSRPNPVVHRDLKPSNVLKTRAGTWALADFGLSCETERRSTLLTSSNRSGMGSMFYSAPEQWKNARTVDQQADIYSLGKILQELVNGEPPTDREVSASVFRSVVLKAIRERPSERHADVPALLAALEKVASAPAGAWEAPREVLDSLADRLREDHPDDAALDELLSMSRLVDEVPGLIRDLVDIVPHLSAAAISSLWTRDQHSWFRVYEAFSRHVGESIFNFGFCDVLADFCKRSISVTADPDVLRVSMPGLAQLGHHHKRWHVQDVLLGILQGIREVDTATIALEGLKMADPSAVRWSISEFAIRSLHPILRDGVLGIVRELADGRFNESLDQGPSIGDRRDAF